MKLAIILVPLGMIIQLLFLFRRELLTDRKFEKLIWIGSAFFFLIGYLVGVKYGNTIKMLPVLMVPLLSYTIYRILLWTYKTMFNAEPVDTFYSMDSKLIKSGIFNFTFWVIGLVVPIIIAFKIIK